MQEVIIIIAAYLIGSVPVGVLLSRMKGKDPRTVGSGNIGATNVMRTAGKAFGAITLLGDICKGLIPTSLALNADLSEPLVASVGCAAFLGHLFPIFLKFRGGKGVATALGVYLALSPATILISAVLFALVLLKWRYVSAGSLAGAASVPLFFYLLDVPGIYIVLSFVVTVLVVLKHMGNIKRLMAGTEHRLGSPKEKATGL